MRLYTCIQSREHGEKSKAEIPMKMMHCEMNKINRQLHTQTHPYTTKLIVRISIDLVDVKILRFHVLPYRTYRSYRQHLNGDALALHCLAVLPIVSLDDLPLEILHNR